MILAGNRGLPQRPPAIQTLEGSFPRVAPYTPRMMHIRIMRLSQRISAEGANYISLGQRPRSGARFRLFGIRSGELGV
jgi:hypothetical protein